MFAILYETDGPMLTKHVEVSPCRPYVFRRGRCSIWEFAFGGNLHQVGGNLKGFEYLARLISQPRTWISPLDLALINEGVAVCAAAAKVTSRDDSLDGKAHRKVTENITKLAAAVEYTGLDNILDGKAYREIETRRAELIQMLGEEEDSVLERELRDIGECLRRAGRPGRKSAKNGTPTIRKACQAVQNSIKRALAALEAVGMLDLASHLKDCARPDNYYFVYRVGNPPDWEVSWIPPIASK